MLRRKMYIFNKDGFERGLEVIKHEFTPDTVAYLTGGAFSPVEFKPKELLESLFSAQTTYPEYKHYFSFTAYWITYKYQKTINVPEREIAKFKENYKKQWRLILESREENEVP